VEGVSDRVSAELMTNSLKTRFSGRLALQQRVLPCYRARFFDSLAAACQGGLSVIAGQPGEDEAIAVIDRLSVAEYKLVHNRHFWRVGAPIYLCWQSGILDWLERWQPDALIVEANSRILSTWWALRWMHERGLPVVGWGLGAPLLPKSSQLGAVIDGIRRWDRSTFIHSLDALIAYSQRGAEQYRSLGFPAERIYVAPNAVSPRPAAPPPARPARSGERPVVLFVGRLQERKRVDHLIQACAALPERLQPRLWIVGDGPARSKLELLAESVYPRAEFFGFRHGSDLAPLFVGADLFVLPGTGGLAIQEAMSFALPVIAAEGDGTQEDLVSPRNGWLVPPDDLPALAHTLQIALADPNRLRRMGEASYQTVATYANIEHMVAVFVQALQAASRILRGSK